MELEEVKLKAEMATTAAREKILAEVEAEYAEGTSSILSELSEEMLKSTPKTMEHVSKSKSSYGKLDKDLVGQNPVQSAARPSKKENTTSRKVDDKEEAGFLLQETELKILQRQNRIIEELAIQQKRATLPRRDTFTFDGDLTQYRTFIRAFETLIEAKEPDHASMLYYLEQYTSGRAQELVGSCLHMPAEAGYKKARSLLEQKFGHKHKIAMAHVQQLTKGNPIKPEDADLLEQFSISLTSTSNTLKAIGYH